MREIEAYYDQYSSKINSKLKRLQSVLKFQQQKINKTAIENQRYKKQELYQIINKRNNLQKSPISQLKYIYYSNQILKTLPNVFNQVGSQNQNDNFKLIIDDQLRSLNNLELKPFYQTNKTIFHYPKRINPFTQNKFTFQLRDKKNKIILPHLLPEVEIYCLSKKDNSIYKIETKIKRDLKKKLFGGKFKIEKPGKYYFLVSIGNEKLLNSYGKEKHRIIVTPPYCRSKIDFNYPECVRPNCKNFIEITFYNSKGRRLELNYQPKFEIILQKFHDTFTNISQLKVERKLIKASENDGVYENEKKYEKKKPVEKLSKNNEMKSYWGKNYNNKIKKSKSGRKFVHKEMKYNCKTKFISEFMLQEMGVYLLSVKIDNQYLKGSPFQINVGNDYDQFSVHPYKFTTCHDLNISHLFKEIVNSKKIKIDKRFQSKFIYYHLGSKRLSINRNYLFKFQIDKLVSKNCYIGIAKHSQSFETIINNYQLFDCIKGNIIDSENIYQGYASTASIGDVICMSIDYHNGSSEIHFSIDHNGELEKNGLSPVTTQTAFQNNYKYFIVMMIILNKKDKITCLKPIEPIYNPIGFDFF
ncbi:jitterbug [Anaeramoeba flamelloides]|uniref:Jitterbug n=1 Tax=Anaeramoeba flamelloides TaxID=1746091 RepID=A0ABQ8YZC7_9EUKA|nr:jitterbug [Anaeramoeba flamelloides]